jgi:hypothetical protein
MNRLRQTLTGTLIGALTAATMLMGSGSAQAVPGPPSFTTWFKVVDVTKASNNWPGLKGDWVDTTRPVGGCNVQTKGITCSVTKEKSVSTTVQVSLGYSRSGVAAAISYSLTRESSSSTTMTSPKMKKGQNFTVYSYGTAKRYKIQKWQGGSFDGRPIPPKLVSTSKTLFAYQPTSAPMLTGKVTG